MCRFQPPTRTWTKRFDAWPKIQDSRSNRRLAGGTVKTYSDAIRVVICMVVIFLAAGSLPAQIDRSSISGTVTDPSGAVVPGATVTVTNAGTSQAVTLITGGDGSYTASLLHVGTYS